MLTDSFDPSPPLPRGQSARAGAAEASQHVRGHQPEGRRRYHLPDCTSAHTAACRAIVADNPARIAIGIAWDGDPVPAYDTVWQNNSGPIVLNDPSHLHQPYRWIARGESHSPLAAAGRHRRTGSFLPLNRAPSPKEPSCHPQCLERRLLRRPLAQRAIPAHLCLALDRTRTWSSRDDQERPPTSATACQPPAATSPIQPPGSRSPAADGRARLPPWRHHRGSCADGVPSPARPRASSHHPDADHRLAEDGHPAQAPPGVSTAASASL